MIGYKICENTNSNDTQYSEKINNALCCFLYNITC